MARSNPGRLIRFGSVRDPNTVYGLADSSLVCLSVEKGTLKIQTVANLSSLTGMGPGQGEDSEDAATLYAMGERNK